MSLQWDTMFRRYVYDAERMPYLTRVENLTRVQAGHELLVFALFIGIFFTVLGFAALAGRLPHGHGIGVPMYAFFTAWAAGVLAWSRSLWTAAICGLAPVAVLVYLATWGFPKGFGLIDKVLLVSVMLLALRYIWRVVRIAATYDTMPPGAPPKSGRFPPFE